MKKHIYIIAAVAKNNAIGHNNKLIYWLPNDLKRFKELTTGNTIIMGRNTFDSLPKGALPNRRNIVLSSQNILIQNCEVFHSLQEAIESCDYNEKIFIIGGAKVYKEALPLANELYLTEIDDTPTTADTFFPLYNNWQEVDREKHYKDEKHNYNYDFVRYTRK